MEVDDIISYHDSHLHLRDDELNLLNDALGHCSRVPLLDQEQWLVCCPFS